MKLLIMCEGPNELKIINILLENLQNRHFLRCLEFTRFGFLRIV